MTNLVTISSEKEIAEKVKAAQLAKSDWGKLGVEGRNPYLEKIYKTIEAKKEKLAKLQSQEMGMPITQSRLDVDGALQYFRWYLDNAAEKKKILQEMYKLAPKRLKDMPDDYWEKKNLLCSLEVTLFYIDELENQSDRDKVWEAWHVLGGSAPSYDTIGIRLLNYLFTSLDTISDFVDKYPKLIAFGEFK